MYTNEKTDRVIWQVTKTTEVLILGRTQAKHMELYQLPRDMYTQRSRTVFSLSGQFQVYRLHIQSRDYRWQSTVWKDCTVYGQSQDYTHN